MGLQWYQASLGPIPISLLDESGDWVGVEKPEQ
jgi:hypothetical protein